MFQAAIVRVVDGKENAERPQTFDSLDAALKYVQDSPVSADGTRPWICTEAPARHLQFLLIAGKQQVPLKERLYRTARIREDLDMPSIGGMVPGQIVAVRFWQHVFDVKSKTWQPLYFISETSDFERHLHEGSFATVYPAALVDFCL